MEVFCDYCGAKLDIEHQTRCPNCGAPFDDNQGVKAYKEEKARKEEHERQVELLRLRQQEIQNTSSVNRSQPVQPMPVPEIKTKKSATSMVISLIISVLVIALPTVAAIMKRTYKTSSSGSSTTRAAITAVPVTKKPAEKKVTVAFGETAQTNNYSIVCDEVYKTDISYYTPSDGYMYVAFHFKAKNTGISKLWLSNDVNCIVNDVICKNMWNMDLKDFGSSNLPAGVSAEGYKCYMVPVDADMVTITYGDYVTMNISLANIEDRTEKTTVTTLATVARSN